MAKRGKRASVTSQMVEWAKAGAQARLSELQNELAAIKRQFPDIGRTFIPESLLPPSQRKRKAGTTGRKRRRMSVAARQAVSRRMRKLWRERRAKAKAKK